MKLFIHTECWLLIDSLAVSISKVLLVPYCEHHVQVYHAWMQDDELQTATASELLTLEEEYAMQQSWQTDCDKLTFIICLPLPTGSNVQHLLECTKAGQYDSANQLIGDINLFLFPNEAESQDGPLVVVGNEQIASSNANNTLIGEIELMIARKDLHHNGYGRNALIIFMDFILSNWSRIAQEYMGKQDALTPSGLPGLAYLRAKISETNERSIRLFESVGFVTVGRGANYFGEVELRWCPSSNALKTLKWYEQPRELRYYERG